MGKKDNNVGSATGYNEKGKRKTRAKKKDQTIFQLGPNVGLWACAKKQKLKHLNCIQLAGKYAPGEHCHFIFGDFHANGPKTGSEGRICLFWC